MDAKTFNNRNSMTISEYRKCSVCHRRKWIKENFEGKDQICKVCKKQVKEAEERDRAKVKVPGEKYRICIKRNKKSIIYYHSNELSE